MARREDDQDPAWLESESAHALSTDAVLEQLDADPDVGLTSRQAAQRLNQTGPNELPRPETEGWIRSVLRHLIEPMSIMLMVAAAVSGAVLSEWVDAAAILAIVAINAVIGVVQEGRAAAALEALRSIDVSEAQVVRDGMRKMIPVAELVPGDVLVLGAGDAVPADARLIHSDLLAVDESVLTGESLAVSKTPDAVAASDAALADRRAVIFAGTLVTAGSCVAVIYATGPMTAFGEIAATLAEPDTTTPLQRELASLSRRLGAATIAVAAVVLLLVIRFEIVGLETAFLLAVALAVAAVPEGLPTAVAVALALGVRRMADKGAIVRRLTAVETLGSATVLLTDKTGTLTENVMRVAGAYAADGTELEMTSVDPAVIRVVAACNDASLESGIGDPVDVALLEWIAASQAVPAHQRLDVIPFDSDTKRMTVLADWGDAVSMVVKGAPETVLDLSDTWVDSDGFAREMDATAVDRIGSHADRLATSGMRVLALAERALDPASVEIRGEGGLTLLAFVALKDPVREAAPAAVATAQRAGVRIVMVTGDHVGTAVSVATDVGLRGAGAVSGDRLRRDGLPDDVLSHRVYARVDPMQKLDLVENLQAADEIVAVTGDGVNDAPALHRADIGVAMGRSGSDVARDAADIVITDDDLSTIVTAVREGRGIYANIRKVVDYLVAGNLSEITVVVSSLLLFPGLGLPLTPIQLLWINLLTDGLPALALGIDPTSPSVMSEAPRSRHESLLGLRRLGVLFARGFVIAASTLASLAVARFVFDRSWEQARTVAFVSLVTAHLLYAFAVRYPLRPRTNLSLVGAVGVALVLQVLVVSVPALRVIFDTSALGLVDWGLVVGAGMAPIAVLIGATAWWTRDRERPPER